MRTMLGPAAVAEVLATGAADRAAGDDAIAAADKYPHRKPLWSDGLQLNDPMYAVRGWSRAAGQQRVTPGTPAQLQANADELRAFAVETYRQYEEDRGPATRPEHYQDRWDFYHWARAKFPTAAKELRAAKTLAQWAMGRQLTELRRFVGVKRARGG